MNNKQWQIGAVKIDGQAILAPMAGSAISLIAYLLKSIGAFGLHRNGQRHGH